MGKLDIANAQASDYTNVVGTVTPDSKSTDGATGDEEYTYQNVDWTKQWGYFNSCPELKSAMLMKSTWNVGKGYTCDTRTRAILDHISGWGKDTFTDILFNLDLISRLGGDSFAQIIRDDKSKILLNLKPLDPNSITIVVDKYGIIKQYRQTTKLPNGQKIKNFQPDEIFHLAHNRLADQIHGISDLISLYSTLDAEFESFTDMKKLMHLQARPLILWKLKTDNATKIAAFVTKIENAKKLGEDMFIPDDEDTVSHEVVEVRPSELVMAWRQSINQKFYRALGLPDIIFGGQQGTESNSKISYLAHEQVFEKDQQFLESQIWNQLFLKINLISPVSLLENLQTDMNKDGSAQMMNMQQNDLQAGRGS